MLIYLIESYYSGSHKVWADCLVKYSKYQIKLFTLGGRFWKWRMQGSAITLAAQVNEFTEKPDLIICSDLIDLACFKSLIKYKDVNIVIYMHENQLTYPISKYSKDNYQELSLGYLNYKSCLCSDHILFNTLYHQNVFYEACKNLLQRMPDNKNLESIEEMRQKSSILPIGFNSEEFFISHQSRSTSGLPTLLFNHRWEHDKRPDLFMSLLDHLITQHLEFKINITNITKTETIQFLKKKYSDHIDFIGHCKTRQHYLNILSSSDILPVTNDHDFFGISVLEAIKMGCYPLLPSNLCYQEHFIIDPQPFIYQDNKHLLELTKTKILEQRSGVCVRLNQSIVKEYGWKHVIKDYDMFFQNMQYDS